MVHRDVLASAPHQGAGIALLVVAVVLAAAAAFLFTKRSPKPVLGGLAGLTVIALVIGLVLVSQSSKSGGVALPSPTPSPTPSETPSPTPSPTPSDTPSPTPSPTASPTPSPTASPTPSPTPSKTVAPTPTKTAKPTPSPTPSKTVSPTPTATTPTGFTADPSRDISCDGTGKVSQTGQITLHNSGTAAATWSAKAVQKAPNSSSPWATLSATGGSVLPGQTVVITVTPAASLCAGGEPDRTDTIDVLHVSQTTHIPFTISPPQ